MVHATITGLAVALIGLASAGPAAAGPAASGRAFAEHVRTCQQAMGFSGTRNPGMHQGISGWDPAHSC
jgi:hypothetical protein